MVQTRRDADVSWPAKKKILHSSITSFMLIPDLAPCCLISLELDSSSIPSKSSSLLASPASILLLMMLTKMDSISLASSFFLLFSFVGKKLHHKS